MKMEICPGCGIKGEILHNFLICRECIKEEKEAYQKWYEWMSNKPQGEVLPE
jgi:hypothetical protein